MIRLLLLAFLSILAFERVVFAESGPVFSDTGPDAEAYGASKGYPVPPFEYPPGVRQDFMIGTYSHFDKVHPMRTVPKPATPSVLKRTAEEIVPVYHYDGRQKVIGDYLDTHPVTGLLIARGDTILFEHYRYARSDRDRLLSNSMAKTITALLVGIATSEGAIRSIDDTAATYVPELAGTEYGATPLRALLRMSSGVAFREQTYQPDDDIINFHKALLGNNPVGAIATLPPNQHARRATLYTLCLCQFGDRGARPRRQPCCPHAACRLSCDADLAKARCRVRRRLGHRSNRARSGLLLLHRHTTRLGAPRIDVGK